MDKFLVNKENKQIKKELRDKSFAVLIRCLCANYVHSFLVSSFNESPKRNYIVD